MDDYAEYAGRLLAGRYRLSRTTADSQDLVEAIAYDTASGQQVLVRQVQLPEVVEAEVVGGHADVTGAGRPGGAGGPGAMGGVPGAGGAGADPAVRRALEAAVAAAQLPDHPRLDQVFDVFVDGEGLWVVSELLPATPLAALLAEQPLGAHRAAEIGADLLAALRAVHAHGWTHGNVTARTVLVCDDGRALLTGLAVGAAQEALCGYDPLPETPDASGAADVAGQAEAFGQAEAAGPEQVPPGGRAFGPARPPGAGLPGAPGAAGEGARSGVRTGLPGNGVGGGSTEAGGGYGAAAGPPPVPRSDGEAPTPARWPGLPLPEGFDARDASEDEAGDGPRDGVWTGAQGDGRNGVRDGVRDGVWGDVPEGGAEGGGGNGPWPYGSRAGDAAGPGKGRAPGHPAGPGRAVPGGAVAAYRAGTQRAAAQRALASPDGPFGEVPRQEAGAQGGGSAHDDWWSKPAPQGPSPDGPPRPRSEPPSQPPSQPRFQQPVDPGPGSGSVPDDCVHWLPPGGDEVSPTSLPGAHRPNSHAVKALWSPATPPPAPERAPGTGSEPGPGTGPEPSFDHEPGAGAEFGPGTEAEFEPGAEAEPDEADVRPWGPVHPGAGYRGPATALAAERARQARMTVVGAVTERWAPEQAGPVYENWRLAPPVGPAADLWALGALLFRAVQGHAPYPEESVAELVRMVCGEPPAFAEDCGPLRPVVESLMRQDPTERPDFEVLSGWLRSLVRSAPEPEAGLHTVVSPPSLEAGRPSDPRRLPILRRRGELVRRRRTQRHPVHVERHRHKREKRNGREGGRDSRNVRDARSGERRRGPRRPGRWVLGLALLGLAAAVLYAMLLMPGGRPNGEGNERQSSVGEQDRAAPHPSSGAPSAGKPDGKDSGKDGGARGSAGSSRRPSSKRPQSTAPAEHAPKGYKLSKDPEGFRIAVPSAWNRRSTPGHGQVVYSGGELEMLVVNGRDGSKKYGKDPMAYQNKKEPELASYRAADWASTTGMRRIDVGAATMAEGTFSWREGSRQVYARNRAMLLHGRYHLILVMGSESEKKEIDRTFETVADTYRVTKG